MNCCLGPLDDTTVTPSLGKLFQAWVVGRRIQSTLFVAVWSRDVQNNFKVQLSHGTAHFYCMGGAKNLYFRFLPFSCLDGRKLACPILFQNVRLSALNMVHVSSNSRLKRTSPKSSINIIGGTVAISPFTVGVNGFLAKTIPRIKWTQFS